MRERHTRVIVHDQIIARPIPGHDIPIIHSCLSNLHKLQFSLIDILTALSGTLRDIVNDRTMMTLGPDSPLQFQRLSSIDFRGDTGWSGGFVADDVGVGVLCGIDEAVVDVFWGRPTDYDWDRVAVLEGGVVAEVVNSAGDDTGDVAVGGDRGDQGGENGEGVHFGDLMVESLFLLIVLLIWMLMVECWNE